MSTQIYARLMTIVGQVDRRESVSAAPIAALIRRLDRLADTRLRASGTAADIRVGVTAKLAAIELDPAAKAMQTAAAIAAAGGGPRTIALALALAKRRLIAACALVLDLPDEVELAQSPEGDAAPSAVPPPIDGAPSIPVLRNIATYHREHERYYTWNKTMEAAEMFREANRLKAVATAWLDDPPLPPLQIAAGDFRDQRFAPAGCNDLNALRAIGAIGVLFMEGEQEPAEIRVLKAKLRGLGPAWQASGQWLANKMEHAWVRESVVLRDDWVAAAEQRYGTIVTNWCGSRQMELAGRCATLALDILESVDWTPASIRADRQGAGRRLLDAAWTLDYAAQANGRSALDLSENERRWTSYLAFLATIPPTGEGR